MDDHPSQLYVQFWRRFLLCVFCVLVVPVAGDENVLFPYGPETGDESVQGIGTRDEVVSLPEGMSMNFQGQSFSEAFILKDGMLSLESGLRFMEVEWREGTPNHAIDRPFIAPFHHDGYIPVNHPKDYPGKIYYKLMSRANNSTITDVDRQFMRTMDDYVESATVLLKSGFRCDFVLKVTWENVSSKDSCSDSDLTSQGCPSNTFQLVIVANAQHTFAIFNYYKMEIPFTVHQLAGVNGGHGRGWTDVIPCTGKCVKRSKGDKSRIASLVSHHGSDVAGRYILVISGDTVVRGGCLPEGLKQAELEVYPRQAGMLGGEMLSVSGPCYEPGTTIFCRFGENDQAVSEGVMETSMRGRCSVPILTTRGEVRLEMSTDNMSWSTGTFITIVHPSRMERPIDMSGIMNAWYELDPADLRVRWTKDLFSQNPAATLQVNLIGYREDPHARQPLIMKNLVQLATNVLNSDQQHTIDPAQFTCTGDDCFDFEIGLVQLRVADAFIDETTKYQTVNLGPIAIGWYVNKAMTQRSGNNWPTDKCIAWNDQDKLTSQWLDHLLPCPCTLSQALADWGRWQPDMSCNMFTGSVCYYHKGAKHCVRSVHPSQDSSANQCCYEQDGNLRYAADTYQGSTPDRSHDWGAAPYGIPDHVPAFSHWLHDVITFYYCCLWVDYKDCNYYMERRATRDCIAYTPPHSATVYGDPHITTFDGKSYYFGGAGDFWILKSSGLNIQGRFEERPNEYLSISLSQLAPTNLTSIVLWTPESDVVTIRLAPLGGPADRKLDVMVGSQRRFFEKRELQWQDFNKVSIVNNAVSAEADEDKRHSNFTVLFVGGAAVQVAERQGLFHVVVILPPSSGQTQGLLGTFDHNSANDFTNPAGKVIPENSRPDQVYLDFAVKWNVSSSESKFHWPESVLSRSPLFGDAKNFTYKAGQEDMKPSEEDVQQVCGDSTSCQRDYYVTADADVARATKKRDDSFEALQHAQKIVRTCGHLDIPMSEKSTTVYTEGSVVTVTGCRPDGTEVQGSGPRVYTCNGTDSSTMPVWTPHPDRDLCPHDVALGDSAPEKASDVGMIVGIVVAVVAVIVIIIIVAVVCVRRKKKSGAGSMGSADKPVPAKRRQVPSDVVIEPGADKDLLKDNQRSRDAVRMSDVRDKQSGDAV